MLRVEFTQFDRKFKKILVPRQSWLKRGPKDMSVKDAANAVAAMTNAMTHQGFGPTKLSFDITEQMDGGAIQRYSFEDLPINVQEYVPTFHELVSNDIMQDAAPSDTAMDLLNKVEQEGGGGTVLETIADGDPAPATDQAPPPEAGMHEPHTTAQDRPEPVVIRQQEEADIVPDSFDEPDSFDFPVPGSENAAASPAQPVPAEEHADIFGGLAQPSPSASPQGPSAAATAPVARVQTLHDYLSGSELDAADAANYSFQAIADRLGINTKPTSPLEEKKLSWYQLWYEEAELGQVGDTLRKAAKDAELALHDQLQKAYQETNKESIGVLADQAVEPLKKKYEDEQDNAWKVYINDGQEAYEREIKIIEKEKQRKIDEATAAAAAEAEKQRNEAARRIEEDRRTHEAELTAKKEQYTAEQRQRLVEELTEKRNDTLLTTKSESLLAQQKQLAEAIVAEREKVAPILLKGQRQLKRESMEWEENFKRDAKREAQQQRQFELMAQRNEAKQQQAEALSKLAEAKVQAAILRAQPAEATAAIAPVGSDGAGQSKVVPLAEAADGPVDPEQAAQDDAAKAAAEKEKIIVANKKRWQKIGGGVAAGVLLCSLGFGAGYASKQTPVSTQQNATLSSKTKVPAKTALDPEKVNATVSSAGKKTLQDLLNDKEYLVAAESYPGKESLAKIENAIYRNGDIPALSSFNTKYPSNLGKLDEAILRGRGDDVVNIYHGLSNEDSAQLDRTQLNAVKLALMERGKMEEAVQIFGKG
jgi:hypothetical protein